MLHSGKERDGERGVLYFTLVRRKTGPGEKKDRTRGVLCFTPGEKRDREGVLNLAPGEKRDEGRCGAALHF